MTEQALPVFRPLLDETDFQAARAALEMGWLGMGSYVGQFEEATRTYLEAGDRHVVAVSTGHAALHLALLVAGVGPGDEVITPSFNNVADFQAILATGADPVFCDIRDDTLCIDLERAEALVSPRTKAIIAMDYDCILCDHDEVGRLAARHGLRVIHDAAHAFGSRYHGKRIGSFSDIAIFSFDPVKTITCIDGGLVVVRTEEEKRALQEMRLIGMGQPSTLMYQNRRAWTYDVNRLGFRYHMANLHAAIGLGQLSKMATIERTRRAACRRYSEGLAGLPAVRIPRSDFEGVVPFLYYIRVPPEARDDLRGFLQERGIDTGIHWQPGHWFTLFKDCRKGDLGVTERVGHEILSLPLHSAMQDADLDRTVTAIRAFFGK
ncbi:aminotransferase [Geothrix oryzae]|uniref:Aminotransferase n=1 Tax=Geothrix oryzae TaxID=2927975 RepID=A0ABN6V327_9BACT|nr:DegT/DnrJ/EryC1/StrS family aminotransferase [Geothrix oryzae]BDU70718.1 aminotransferase [Geothrix oryzae]